MHQGPPTPSRTLVALIRSPGVRWLALVCVLGWGLAHALSWMGGPQAVRARYGFEAAALLIPIHAVVAVSPVPSEVMATAHGAIYGFELGSLFTWAGWMLAAWLEYALFRRIASDVSAARLGDRLPARLRRLPAGHPAFLVLGRLIPFGNHVVNAVAGCRRVPLWRFTWPTALALVPFSVLIAAIGSGLVSGCAT